MAKQSWFSKNAVLFFPEIIPAAGIVLMSPIWEIQLVHRGRIAAALILPLGVMIGSYLFIFGCREKLKWIAYVAILVMVATALATHTFAENVVR